MKPIPIAIIVTLEARKLALGCSNASSILALIHWIIGFIGYKKVFGYRTVDLKFAKMGIC